MSANAYEGDKSQLIGVTDILCEGPIAGLVNGSASVYFDNNTSENSKYWSYKPPRSAQVGTDVSGTITFNNSTTGTVDSNTFIPVDLTNYVEKARRIELFESGEAYVEVTLSNHILPTNSNNQRVTLTRSTGTFVAGTHNTDHSAYNGLVRASELEIHWDDGSVSSHKGHFNRTSDSQGYFEWGKAHGLLDANNLPGKAYLKTVKITNVVSINASTGTIVTENTFNGTFGFAIQAQFTFASNADLAGHSFDPDAPISKVQNLYVQENRGTKYQRPLKAVAGVGSNATTPGTTSGINLPELKMIHPTNTYNVVPASYKGMPNTEDDSKKYPGIPDYSDTNSDPTILNSSNFGLTTSASKVEADKLSFTISYPSGFFFQSPNDSKRMTCYAFYLCQIEFKIGSSTTFTHNRDLFPNGVGTLPPDKHHTGQPATYNLKHKGDTNAPVNFQHIIDMSEYEDLDYTDFRIKIFRVSRHIGLPICSNGNPVASKEGGGTDKRKFTVVAKASISALSSSVEDKFSYPYTAHISSVFSSRNFQQEPKRSYDIQGKMIKIPNGYVPREYSPTGKAIYPEFWDGTFTLEIYYTDNPAWIFYDILLNDRYGTGKWITESDIDVYALYRISKYCDELVDTNQTTLTSNAVRGEYYKIVDLGNTSWNTFAGTSGVSYSVGDEVRAKVIPSSGTGKISKLEPRFRTNLLLTKSTPVYKVLKDMASNFLSLLYWMNGKITLSQDVPQSPVASFSKSNVIDGRFSYESSSFKNRVNQVIVLWNNPSSNYELEKLIVEDSSAIIREERIISKEVTAFGCTSESQAIRYGKWKLWTAQNQIQVVSFSTGLESKFIRPGDVINVHDTDRKGLSHSGRISAVTSTSITFDRAVAFNGSSTYQLLVTIAGGKAVYTGVENITIDGETYSRGDFLPKAHAYVDTNADGTPDTLELTSLDSEEKASNARDSSGEVISVEWRPNFHTEIFTLPSSSATTNTVTLNSGDTFSTLPLEGSIWALRQLESADLEEHGSSKMYKILSITYDDSLVATISAAEHSNLKFEGVEVEYDVPQDGDVSAVEPDVVPPPETVSFQKEGPASNSASVLKLSWVAPNFDFIAGYELESPLLDTATTVTGNSYLFQDVPSGVHLVRIRTVSLSGNYSDWVTVQSSGTTDVPAPINLEHGVPKCAITSSKGVIRRDSTSTGQEEYSNTAPLFQILHNQYNYGNRQGDSIIWYWNGQVIRRESTLRGVRWDISGDKYEKGSLQSGPTQVNSNLTQTRYAIRSTNSSGAAGREVFEFENYPVTITSCSDPTNTHTINARSPNGYVDLSGVTDNDTRALYVYFSAEDEKVFLAEWDVNANGSSYPAFWRDAGEPMTDAWTALTGTATIAASSTALVGTGTSFTTELEEGDVISLENLSTQTETLGKAAIVASINSNTSVTLDRSFADALSLTNLYRASYRPDKENDAILATISRPT